MSGSYSVGGQPVCGWKIYRLISHKSRPDPPPKRASSVTTFKYGHLTVVESCNIPDGSHTQFTEYKATALNTLGVAVVVFVAGFYGTVANHALSVSN